MKKAEKKLVKKLLKTDDPVFTQEENIILERWMAHKIVNEEAFVDMTAGSSNHKEYLRGIGYPFTSHGEEEINKNWYMQFRSSKGIVVIYKERTYKLVRKV